MYDRNILNTKAVESHSPSELWWQETGIYYYYYYLSWLFSQPILIPFEFDGNYKRRLRFGLRRQIDIHEKETKIPKIFSTTNRNNLSSVLNMQIMNNLSPLYPIQNINRSCRQKTSSRLVQHSVIHETTISVINIDFKKIIIIKCCWKMIFCKRSTTKL